MFQPEVNELTVAKHLDLRRLQRPTAHRDEQHVERVTNDFGVVGTFIPGDDETVLIQSDAPKSAGVTDSKCEFRSASAKRRRFARAIGDVLEVREVFVNGVGGNFGIGARVHLGAEF